MKAGVKQVLRRAAQTLRLMVGVGDYEQYVAHVRTHHPELAPMSRADFFRHAQATRYPSADGSIKRCPC